MKYIDWLKNWINRHSWLMSGLVVVFISVLAYLPFITKLGIYRDDWSIIYGGSKFGVQIFLDMFSIDRPFIGFQYYLLYKLLGGQVLFWHLTAYVLRVIGALLFMVLVWRLWPKQSPAGLVMGALFVIYPGFLQQANGITYITHLIVMLFMLLSLLTTVLAVQTVNKVNKTVYYLVSLVCMVYYLLLLEYVIGIEGLRFALLVYLTFMIQKEKRFWQKVKTLGLNYAPFLLTVIGFLVWRLFFFDSVRGATDVDLQFGRYVSLPFYQILLTGFNLLQDFWEITFAAWFVPLYQLAGDVRFKQQLTALFFGALAGVIIAVSLWFHKKNNPVKENDHNQNWPRIALWMGVFGVLTSILPVIVSGRYVMFESILTVAFDRYSFHAIPAVTLLLGGIIFSFSDYRRRLAVITLLVGTALITQQNAASIFANAWENNRQFWWQMSWRVPQIQPETVLMAYYAENTVILEEYQVSYPAMSIYYPDTMENPISSAPINPTNVEKVVMGKIETGLRRSIPFTTDFSRVLLAYFPTQTSCLHVVDGDFPVLSPGSDPLVEWLAPYSDLTLIDIRADEHVPPADVFGEEPPHSWCYYYQRASLAAQAGNWNEVIQLAELVDKKGLKPVDRSEWLPFLLAYINMGDTDAAHIVISYIKDIDYIRYQVCKPLIEQQDIPMIQTIQARQFLFENLCQW